MTGKFGRHHAKTAVDRLELSNARADSGIAERAARFCQKARNASASFTLDHRSCNSPGSYPSRNTCAEMDCVTHPNSARACPILPGTSAFRPLGPTARPSVTNVQTQPAPRQHIQLSGTPYRRFRSPQCRSSRLIAPAIARRGHVRGKFSTSTSGTPAIARKVCWQFHKIACTRCAEHPEGIRSHPTTWCRRDQTP